MISVEELIGNLLLRHNCVIVPSFGGFVAKQSSATIDYKNGVMLPPRKSILFNRQLINNDGLLISEFASTNQVYYSSAEATVKFSVSDWNEKLRNGERVTLDRVGYLFYDQEKNICFEQDRFFNLLLESYGLGKVHFVAEEDLQIIQHKVEIKPVYFDEEKEATPFKLVTLPILEVERENSEESVNIIEHPEVKSSSKMWKYIAAAVLIPIGFYSFWIPMKTNVLESGVLSFRDFNTFYKAEEGSYLKSNFANSKFVTTSERTLEEQTKNLPSDVYVYSYSFDGEPIHVLLKENTSGITEANVEVIKAPVEVITPKIEVVKTQKTPVSKSGSLHFIVGSFSNEENAKAVIADLKSKGLEAYQLVDKGLFKVSAGNAKNSTEMKSISEKSKTIGYSGWTFVK